VQADLGRDQGRETALLDKAHLDGWLAINWHQLQLLWGQLVTGRRTWAGKTMEGRWGVDGEVVQEAASFCRRRQDGNVK
jgi:hypothetical protein